MAVSDREFRDRVMAQMPQLDEHVQPINFAEAYARLAALALHRAEWLGRLLADQLEEQNMEGLVGYRYGIAQETGAQVELTEELRALVKLEAAERDRAERMTRDGIRIGIEARQVDAMRGYARTVSTVIRHVVRELGFAWNDEAVRRAAQRGVLAARQAMGLSFASPDQAGPPLSSFERARLGAGDSVPDVADGDGGEL